MFGRTNIRPVKNGLYIHNHMLFLNNNNKSIYKVHHRDYPKCTHMHPHPPEYTDYTKFNLHNLTRAAKGDLRRMKTAARNGKLGRSIVLEEKCFEFIPERV